MSNGDEPSLTSQGIKVIGNFGYVELPPIVKDHRYRNAEASDDIFSDKLSNVSCDNGGDSLSFNSLSEIIHRNKKVFTLSGGARKGSKDVHDPCSEWLGIDDQC